MQACSSRPSPVENEGMGESCTGLFGTLVRLAPAGASTLQLRN
jgi:hypothetical protein